MPNFFINSTFPEADFLIRKPIENIVVKLKGPVVDLKDNTKGTMAHWFARNPKTEFMVEKLEYLWSEGVKKEEIDAYGKYAVEYLIYHLEKKINFIKEYNGVLDENKYSNYFKASDRSFRIGEKEIFYIKNILNCIGSLLPPYEFMKQKGLDIKMKEVSEVLNSVIKFEQKYYGIILEQQNSKKQIEDVLINQEEIKLSKPKKRI